MGHLSKKKLLLCCGTVVLLHSTLFVVISFSKLASWYLPRYLREIHRNDMAAWMKRNATHRNDTAAWMSVSWATTVPAVQPKDDIYSNLTFPRQRAKFTLEPSNVFGEACSSINSDCRNIRSEKDCETTLNIVVFVKSKANYFKRRETIRSTWGRFFFVKSVQIERIFVLGQTENEVDQRLIIHENKTRGDILQYDGPDDYKNMPLKVMSAMQWASDNLPPFYLYASSDDDFVINFAEVIDFLHNQIDKHKAINRRPSDAVQHLPITCIYFLSTTTKPVRDKDSKYYVSEKDYSLDLYPAFCGGGFYTAPVSMVTALSGMAKITRSLPMDDVWVTGILRRKLGQRDDNIIAAKWPLGAPKDMWKHLWGDYGKKTKNIVDLIKSTWKKWDESIRKLPHCIR